MRLTKIFILLLLLIPGLLHAAEEIIVLKDGSRVKVFMFYPTDHGEGPWPLTVLMSGGTGNEYVVRAQFWLGHELTKRGWAIAFPVSPDGNSFFGENGARIPEVIAHLQTLPRIELGKSLLVGVSNGGSSAIEIANRNAENYYGVVAVPGIIKDDVEISNLQNLPVYLRIGEDDFLRWNRHLASVERRLSAAGAIVDAKLVPGGKHVFPINWEELQPWLDTLR